jgi:hypothetical protein
MRHPWTSKEFCTMDKIPVVGGARGVFEIFVPGLFLFANLLIPLYALPWTRAGTLAAMQQFANPAAGLVLLVCFGYLLGVLLRLARADTPDRWSSWYLKRYHRDAKLRDGSFAQFAVDRFPYFEWLKQSCRENLPSTAFDYFNLEWAPRKLPWRNKRFFSLCKLAIVHTGNPIANEVYAAEALTRYVACMFYALVISLAIALLAGAVSFPSTRSGGTAWLVLAALYASALWVIVKNYRFVRFKEVDTVFTACFISRIRFGAEDISEMTAAAKAPS